MRFFASLRMTVHYVVARHDSAEAISEGYEIATHLSGARNDKREMAQNDIPFSIAKERIPSRLEES